MHARYEVAWNRDANRLEFALRGIFDRTSFSAWDTAVRAVLQEAPAPGWTTLADMSDFPPQAPELQRGAEEQIALTFALGCVMSVVIVPRLHTARQLLRYAEASASRSRVVLVPTRTEALAVLDGERPRPWPPSVDP